MESTSLNTDAMRGARRDVVLAKLGKRLVLLISRDRRHTVHDQECGLSLASASPSRFVSLRFFDWQACGMLSHNFSNRDNRHCDTCLRIEWHNRGCDIRSDTQK